MERMDGNGSTRKLEEWQREIYKKLFHEYNFSKPILRALKIDFRLLHYYFTKAPMHSPYKEKFIEELIEKIEKFFPHYRELLEELRSFLSLLKSLRTSSKKFISSK